MEEDTLQKSILVDSFLDVVRFDGKRLATDDFMLMITNWNKFPELPQTPHKGDNRYDYLFEYECKYMIDSEINVWQFGNYSIALFTDDESTSGKIEVILTGILQHDNHSEDHQFYQSLMLVIYQTVKASLMNRIIFNTKNIIDLLLKFGLQDPCQCKIICTILRLLLLDMSEFGFTPSQLRVLNKNLSKSTILYDLYQDMFRSDQLMLNSLIVQDKKLQFKNININPASNSFVLSLMVRFSQIYNFPDSEKINSELFVLSGPTNIVYGINDGILEIQTSTEKHSFRSYSFDTEEKYNISFLHINESSRISKIDLYVNGIFIESKVFKCLFTDGNKLSSSFTKKLLLSFKNDKEVHNLYNLTISNQEKKSPIVIEISDVLMVETRDWKLWIFYIHLLGENIKKYFELSKPTSLLTSSQYSSLIINVYGKFKHVENIDKILSKQNVKLVWNSENKGTYKSTNENSDLISFNTDVSGLKWKQGISMLESFSCIYGYTYCLHTLEKSENENDLFHNLSFLLYILETSSEIEQEFVADGGYYILGIILREKNRMFTFELVNLILNFVGYNTLNSDESFLKNKLAFRMLIFDFHIWKDCINEIRKFMVFQLIIFIQDTKYKEVNLVYMSDMKILKRILLALKRSLIGKDILLNVDNILWILVRSDSSPETFKSLLTTIVYMINASDCDDECAMLLDLVSKLIKENAKLLRYLNFKFLFSTLQGSLKIKEQGLKLMIRLINSNSKTYSDFLSFGGIPLLTNYLRNDWMDDGLMLSIYQGASTGIKHIDDFSKSSVISHKHFLGILNNIMKFCALSLDSTVESEKRLTQYLKALKVTANSELFNCDIEWIGNVLFLAMIIKQNGTCDVEKRILSIVNEWLVCGDINIDLLESISSSFPVEFNAVVVPMLIDKLETYKKSGNFLNIFQDYYHCLDEVWMDDNEILIVLEMSIEVIKKTVNFKRNKIFAKFLNAYFKLFINFVEKKMDENVIKCCEIYMAHFSFIMSNIDETCLVILFSIFNRLLKKNDVLTVSTNCIRLMVLDYKGDIVWINKLKEATGVDDDEFIAFIETEVGENMDKTYRDFLVKATNTNSSSKTIKSYIFSKMQLERSENLINKEIKPFNKNIYEAELQNIQSYICDENKDELFFINKFLELKERSGMVENQEKKRILKNRVGIDNKFNKIVDKVILQEYSSPIFDDILAGECTRSILRELFVHDRIEQIFNIATIHGIEANEGILIIGLTHLYMLEGYWKKQNNEMCYIQEADDDERDEIIQILHEVCGTNDVKRAMKSKKIAYKDIKIVSERRFLLRDVALELFTKSGESVFMSCKDNYHRDLILKKVTGIMGAKPSHCGLDEIVELWTNGKMSNFTYLMELNKFAGRSTNDLSQYPIFPWILKDYTSSNIDLKDENVYRDLKLPMGAQSEERSKQFKERYELGGEFNYGTHYSSSMSVSSYLVRLEPFRQIFINLQGGKGPKDRQFQSILRTWIGCGVESTADVRELIPEFYYMPEFLVGSGQELELSSVELPKWSEGDVTKFIKVMRDALESEYVSKNLNHWIDLIFGFKQRGEAAVENLNVFHPNSYEWVDDEDRHSKKIRVSSIFNFGQVPTQLFKTAHPQRKVFDKKYDETIFVLKGTEIEVGDKCKIVGYANGLIKVFSKQKIENCRVGKVAREVGGEYVKYCVRKHEVRIEEIQCSEDESISVSIDVEGKYCIWDLDDGEILGFGEDCKKIEIVSGGIKLNGEYIRYNFK